MPGQKPPDPAGRMELERLASSVSERDLRDALRPSPAQTISVRFRPRELERIDALGEEMGLGGRTEVLRAAIELLRAERSEDYRRDRRAEAEAFAFVDDLKNAYGPEARLELRPSDGTAVELLIDGERPSGLRAEAWDHEGHAVIDIVHEERGVAIRNAPSWAMQWDDWTASEGYSMPLASLSPRRGRPPLRDPR